MRGRGEAILEYLVKRADGARTVREIAEAVGARDGRSVAQPLRHLENAGLVHQTLGKAGLWYPTGRGREVDAILDRITSDRGGEFVPTKEAGIVWNEHYALRRA